MNHFGEIKLVGMAVARCVGAIDFAKLALEAGIEDLFRFRSGYLPDIPVVLVVNEREEVGKGIAILEAEPAPVADLEDPLDFLAQAFLAPIIPVGRVVR
jgi:hypothetical protein